MKRFKKDGNPTKQFQTFMKGKYAQYMRSTSTSLYDVYAKPSQAKLEALELIKTRSDTLVYIISYNQHFFTVAYFVYDEALDTNLFVVETNKNIYLISEDFIWWENMKK